VKRMLLACVVAIVVVSLVIGGCTTPEVPAPTTPTPTTPAPTTPAPPTSPKTVTLKAAFNHPATHPTVSRFKEAFSTLEEQTSGRVKIEVYDSQTLVKVPEALDALNRGIADITSVPLPIYRTDIPWWGVEVLPGLIKSPKGAHDAALNGIMDMYQEALHSLGLKIKIAYLYNTGVIRIVTKDKRVAVPEDLKGLKIQAFDQPSADKINALGGTAVVMPVNDAYEALLRGMLDGATGTTDAIPRYKWPEVCDYMVMYPLGGPYVGILVSEESLSKLSAADQATVISLGKLYGLTDEIDFATGVEYVIDELIAPEMKEVVYPTPEQTEKWDETLAPLIDAWLAEAGEDGQKAFDIMRKYNP
jgi:TRAP-type C4-dicarboxylate transport system substrate-binding protein